MKILVLSNLYPPLHAGTFDVRCQTVVEALRRRGHEICVLTSTHGLKSEQIDPEIERRLRLAGAFGHPSLTSFRDLKAMETHNYQVLQESLGRHQPQILYIWSLLGLSKSLLFPLRLSRLPVVFDVADHWLDHELPRDPWLQWWNHPRIPLLKRLNRLLLESVGGRRRIDRSAPTRFHRGYKRMPDLYLKPASGTEVQPWIGSLRFDRLYFCSQALKHAALARGFKVQHAEVIYPAVDTHRFVGEVRATSAPVKKFLLVTPLEPQSGVITAVQALKMARQRGIQASLHIYGKGESDYVAQVRSLIVADQLPVEFLAVSNLAQDLPGLYRRHDAFLHTAEWDEPFALAPLEAMASGLPVIAARGGGLGELLRSGENALLYSPGNVEELAGCLQTLRQQPDLHLQLAETAQQEVASRHNESVVVDRIEQFLAESLEQI